MNPGDHVRVTRADTEYEGIVMPSSSDDILTIKVDGGYNVGVRREVSEIDVLESNVYEIDAARETAEQSTIAFDDDLPTISLISTGGTIASTVDYRTGAVTARFDAEDILRAVPDLGGLANFRGRVVANILSENMSPNIWRDLAKVIFDEIESGSDGIVIMHGTDTMQFTASAIAFMIDTPVPIVFTGSQRSADRPSSDNVMNAVCAVSAAKSDIAEVIVCMHATSSDDRCALHRATRVRKNHTSRRDAFETVGNKPLGSVDFDTLDVSVSGNFVNRNDRELSIDTEFEPNVELIKFTPGTDVSILEAQVGRSGIVIEGTGLGHVHTDWIEPIADITDSGIPVVMTSQCLNGRVCDRVYDTGRDLLEAGVIEGENMLPGTAKVKLMWALARPEVKRDGRTALVEIMRSSIAGELTERSVPWV